MSGALDRRVRIIEDRAGFEALRAPWQALDAGPGVRPFQQYEWIAAWVGSIGAAGGWRLKIATPPASS